LIPFIRWESAMAIFPYHGNKIPPFPPTGHFRYPDSQNRFTIPCETFGVRSPIFHLYGGRSFMMRYKLLGHSGLRVSELCLGALTFGEDWGWGAPREESERVFHAYVERGGNFIDTANKYNDGTSEAWTGEFIARDRHRFVLATKFACSMHQGDPNSGGNHRKNLVRSLEDSLKRLKTDYIDLYWLHQWDYTTPVEEFMRALDDQVSAGKILYVGISDTPAWVASQANTLAALRGWTPFIGMQIEYSLIERTAERDLLPMARAFGLGVTPWGVVGGGVLTGKYHTAADPTAPPDSKRAVVNSTRVNERSLAIAAEVQAVAAEINEAKGNATDGGVSPAQVALNWVRQQPGQVIPIVGARTAKQAADNLACLDWSLDDGQLRRLDQVSRIEMGFPHEFINRPRIVEQRHGGTQHLLDNHHPWRHLGE